MSRFGRMEPRQQQQQQQQQQQEQEQEQQSYRTLFQRNRELIQSRKSNTIQDNDEMIQLTTALHLESMKNNSVFFWRSNQERRTDSFEILSFTPSQIELGNVLGMGQYGVINEVNSINNKNYKIMNDDCFIRRNDILPIVNCKEEGLRGTNCHCLQQHCCNPNNQEKERCNGQYSHPSSNNLYENRKHHITCLASRKNPYDLFYDSAYSSYTMRRCHQQDSQSTLPLTLDGTDMNSNQSLNQGSCSIKEENENKNKNHFDSFSLMSADGIDIDDLFEQSGNHHETKNLSSKVCNHGPYKDCEQPRYVVKQIRKDLYPQKKMEATIDLAREAKFLSHLSHPNIIKLRATVAQPGQTNFMVILDRLNLTLYDKICQWKDSTKKSSRIGGLWKQELLVSDECLLTERLLALYDIAQAMRYLHRNMIIFRDLKPENVALDSTYVMQLFDFGLAKELKVIDLIEAPDGYKMTGLTGTPRIMAPEVIQCQNYGLSADVYSFGILFWEVFACKMADFNLHVNALCQQVVTMGMRPKQLPRSYISRRLEILMECCWSANPTARPSFESLCEHLETEIVALNERNCHSNNNLNKFGCFR